MPAVFRGAAGLACVAGAVFLANPPEEHAHAASTGPRWTLGGAAVNGDAALDARLDAFLGREVHLRVGDRVIPLARRSLGVSIDRERLDDWLDAVATTDAPLARQVADRDQASIALPWPIAIDRTALRERLLAVAAETDRVFRDARLGPDGELGASIDGRRLDVWKTADRIERAIAADRVDVEAVVAEHAARIHHDDLAGARFDRVVGGFETVYNSTEEARDRTHNLRVAASRVDGVVLRPGETFSFNAVVGERNEVNGFRPAPVIAGGELTDGVGGGACQIAGTLHAAVFFAGLTVEERHPHSRPSTYIRMGLDATVTFPSLDFRFRNDLRVPIALRVTVAAGRVTAQILGHAEPPLVTLVRRIDDVVPYSERIEEDPTLPAGVRLLSQRGVAGFTTTRFRIVRDLVTGQALRQRTEDRYPPTTQVVRLGTGGPAPEGYEPPEGDDHDEYTADVYTEITQGPGIEGTLLVRREGRTGTPGWTAREGMPQYAP